MVGPAQLKNLQKIWYMFLISVCKGKSDQGACMTSLLAQRMQLRSADFRGILRPNTFFKPPNLSALRLIADIYTIAQNDTQILNNSNHVINTSNAISTRIINLPTPNLSTYKLIADIYTIT